MIRKKAAVNTICGWQYPETTIRDYLESITPMLLTMDFDFPCRRKCNLKCNYCFVDTDEREDKKRKNKQSKKLEISQIKDVFHQARNLGCRSGKLVGDQESSIEKDFLDFLRFTSEELKMWIVIFTNGLIFESEEKCRRIHGLGSDNLMKELKRLRVSIMLKFHSFDEKLEDALVGRIGYTRIRNKVLERLIDIGFNAPPKFETTEEMYVMTGIKKNKIPETWTRLGLESVITPQCLFDIEKIYKMKAMNRLYVDLDPPVPIGLTRSDEWREESGLSVPKEELLEACLRIYRLNEVLGIPFVGPSPYFGGLPCSQLPYGLYVNARGRIYPCCGCPENEMDGRSEYLGNVRQEGALVKAIRENPYRINFKKYGTAYNKLPFNDPSHPGYGIYHGCPYRDRAGDIMPENWELAVEQEVRRLREKLTKAI